MKAFKKALSLTILLVLTACTSSEGDYGLIGQTVANHKSSFTAEPPRQIALLVPLSGSLSSAGHAIRDGFMDAYTQASNQGQTQAIVKFYDTNSTDILSLYQQAVQDGANMVVGPLDKMQAQQVVKLSHPVTTIVLNYPPQSPSAANVLEFGLSPVDEAQSAASKARTDGHQSIIIIAPQTQWGQNVAQAFASRWTKSGGNIADQLNYSSNQDFNNSIKQLLHFNDAVLAANKKSGSKGQKVTADEVRRTDFDSIFLLATPDTARQVNPLLKYYYAGNVAIYSTSQVYSGKPSALKDRDLDGIMFSDMPWLLGTDIIPAHSQPNARLYALGLDAYTLASKLNQLASSPQTRIQGATGALSINGYQVERQLLWARFSHGMPYQLAS